MNGYRALSNAVALPAGQGAGYVAIIPMPDITTEPLETVILTLAGSGKQPDRRAGQITVPSGMEAFFGITTTPSRMKYNS